MLIHFSGIIVFTALASYRPFSGTAPASPGFTGLAVFCRLMGLVAELLQAEAAE